MLISHARDVIPNSAANPLPTPFWRTKFRCGQSRPTQFKALITLIFLANRGIFWTLGQILSLLSGRGSRPGRRAQSELRLTTGLRGRKVPPARHPLDADRDDREVVERHPLILRVARAEHGLRPVVLGAVGQDLGRAAQHDPAEPGPVLVPAIGDKSGDRVIDNISETLQCPDVALRLLIDRDVECTLADDKTYRHEMRRCPGIGRRQVTDPAAGEKPALLVRQHARTLHEFGAAGQTPRVVAISRPSQTDEAGHEDRAHRPSEPDRRRYRPQCRVLPAGARHEDREYGGRPCRTLFRPAEDPSRRRRRGHGDERRKTHAGAYLLYHRGADERGHRPSRKLRRAGADAGPARRGDRHDPIGLYRRPRSALDRDCELLSVFSTGRSGYRRPRESGGPGATAGPQIS